MAKKKLTLIAGALCMSQPVTAQQAVQPAAGQMSEQRRLGEEALRRPDTPGTGPFPAVKEELASLPQHVVYRPRDLTKVGKAALPILVWGNGGCAGDGANARMHLAEIASHGYLVIANGTVKSGPGHTQPPNPPRDPKSPPPPPETTAEQLIEGIDWAVAEGRRPGSPLFGKVNTKQVGVSGWSCGGVQAINVATSDPRIKAVVIHNSGLFAAPPPMPGMNVPKSALERLHTPIIYILGGPTDIAYANGSDDYAKITKVPAVMVNLVNAGHIGSFFQSDGGKGAQVSIAWLDWQLKGDKQKARWFQGADCGLCRDPSWQIERKGIN